MTGLNDLRYAARTLRSAPISTCAAIATLALGIGATTAVFSTVNATLLRPLPYPQSHDLYSLGTAFPDGGMTIGLVAPAELVPLRNPGLVVERVAGLTTFDATLLLADGTPVQPLAFGVTEGFFELFGLPMTLGSSFSAEHHVPGGPGALVLSHRAWRTLFGSDPAIVGTAVRIAETVNAQTVIGVASPDLDLPRGVDFWINLRLNPQSVIHNLEAFLRVRPGTSPERLRTDLEGVMLGVAQQFPATNTDRIFVVRPLVTALVGDLGPTLVVVLSATALLLLLACVNVTTLLLVRGATRAREVALRVAIGASRWQIVRQLFTESIVLAATGALAGLLLAHASVRVLLLVGAEQLPRLEAIPFDWRVLAFALVALVVSGVVVGFAPALRLALTDVRMLVNEGGRTAAGGRGTHRWLSAMTVVEIALAITLLAGAGWLVRSYDNLRTSDPGFASAGRLVFDLSLPPARYQQPAVAMRELSDRIRRISGVTGIGAASSFPLRSDRDGTPFVAVHGVPFNPNRPPIARQRTVTPAFFETVGIRMASGRGFTAQDVEARGVPAVIVNETFVRRYLGGQDPLTAQLSIGYPTINMAVRRPVVGVVEDVRYKSLGEEPEPAYYVVSGGMFRQTVVVATSLSDPAGVIPDIRDELARFDPQLVVELQAVPAVVAATLGRQQLGMTLMIVFGAIALLLAAVGIYGVIAYSSAQRQGEVATRMVLGASRSTIFRMLLGRGGTLAVAGGVIGIAAAYATGRLASGWLYQVRAFDPAILTLAAVIVTAITVLAIVISARRAATVDPAATLQAG